MPRARNGDVELEYEVFGTSGEVVLLINGLGAQLLRWPADFCQKLVSRGYVVVRMDNRDVGLSSWLPGRSYVLSDMARDCIAVVDAVGAEKFHAVGVSMGAMIAQLLAIEHPHRVLSLVSIMSTTGAPDAFRATPEAMAVLGAALPDPKADYAAFLERAMANNRVIESPGYRWTEEELRERAEAEYKRAYNPPGVARQRAAIAADGDRTERLGKVKLPTVVLHGKDDPLVMPIGGEATAKAVPGAELRLIDGMGHNLPPGLHDVFLDAITAAAERARTKL
ncbi:alpha/beta hydrolase fold protein [Hyaloraphidium curvatum]|nr:alpha/beta hydrolase fold protein [Hyaloraphidium curvatum]